MSLKISLKYEYLDDVEFYFFPFPISNHDVIRHIKDISKEIIFKIIFKCLKAFKIMLVFGILKSP